MVGNSKVSVVMSVYNGEEFIRESIDSLLSQNYSNMEIIITDDCSTDKTHDILKEYMDSRVFIMKNNERKGLTYNLNRMIERASGDYIARLDADDIANKDRLRKQAQYLDNHPEVTLVCSFVKCIGDSNGTICPPQNGELLRAALLFWDPIVHSSVMFRNKEISYNEDYKKAQDYELWSRLNMKGVKFGIINEPLTIFRVHNKQISKTSSREQMDNAIKIHLRSLRELGVIINEAEKRSYLMYLKENDILNLQEMKILDDIYRRIESCNNEKLLFCKRALHKIIRYEYEKMYYIVQKIGDADRKTKKEIFFKAISIGFINRYVKSSVKRFFCRIYAQVV